MEAIRAKTCERRGDDGTDEHEDDGKHGSLSDVVRSASDVHIRRADTVTLLGRAPRAIRTVFIFTRGQKRRERESDERDDVCHARDTTR